MATLASLSSSTVGVVCVQRASISFSLTMSDRDCNSYNVAMNFIISHGVIPRDSDRQNINAEYGNISFYDEK